LQSELEDALKNMTMQEIKLEDNAEKEYKQSDEGKKAQEKI